MKVSINKYEFSNMFDQFNRSENFSREAREDLFEYLEELFGDDYEVDIIAICCEYSEDTIDNIIDNYSIDIDQDEDKLQQVLDYLNDHTSVVSVTGDDESILYAAF